MTTVLEAMINSRVQFNPPMPRESDAGIAELQRMAKDAESITSVVIHLPLLQRLFALLPEVQLLRGENRELREEIESLEERLRGEDD